MLGRIRALSKELNFEIDEYLKQGQWVPELVEALYPTESSEKEDFRQLCTARWQTLFDLATSSGQKSLVGSRASLGIPSD